MNIQPVSPEIEPTPTSPVSQPADTWRRVGAFAVDWLLISIAVSLISNAFVGDPSNYVLALSILPLLISFPYWATMHSNQCGGQSFGMRVFGIKVVSASGRLLYIENSIGRAVALCFYTTLPGAVLTRRLLSSDFGTVVIIVFAMCIASSGYLALFNREGRQWLHDLFAKSYVVRAKDSGPVTNQGFFWAHWCLLPLFGLAAILVVMPFADSIRSAATAVEALKDIETATPSCVQYVTLSSGHEPRLVSITMILAPDTDPRAVAKKVADRVESHMGTRLILVKPTFDAGILSSSHVWRAWIAQPGEPDIAMEATQDTRFLFFTVGYGNP